MFTEKEVRAAPLTSMLFWTCTKASPGPTAVVPVPVTLVVWGLLLALSVTLRVAVRVPAAVGVKVTLIVQLPPAGTLAPQVLVGIAKSPLFVPVTAMLVMLNAVLPGLESVAT